MDHRRGSGRRDLDKFGLLTGRFARFAAAHRVTTLAAVDRTLVVRFVAARAALVAVWCPMRRWQPCTTGVRRCVALFCTARRLWLTLYYPTTGIDVAARQSSVRRTLSEDEAALVRLFSDGTTPTRRAATVALLLAGAHTL